MSKDSQDKKFTSRDDVLDSTLEKYYAAAENANNPDDDNEMVPLDDSERISLGELRKRIKSLEDEKKNGVVTEETISITPSGDEFEKSYREKYKGLLKEEYPDDDFEDEDNFFKRAIENNSKRKELKTSLDSVNKKNQELNDFLDDDPRLGAFLSEVYSGASIPHALGKFFDKEEVFPEGDAQSEEDYQKGKSERDARIKERNEAKKRWEDNIAANESVLSEFSKKRGLDEGKSKEFFDKVVSTLGSVKEGKIPSELLDFLYDGYNYDSDLEIARKAGEVDGRNQKIALTRRTFSEDLPNVSGAGVNGGEDNGGKYKRMIEDIDKRDFWKNSKQ